MPSLIHRVADARVAPGADSALHPDLQSVLAPRGAPADELATMTWVLVIGGTVVFLIVAAIAAYALLGRPEHRARLARPGFILGAGAVFPGVVLTALLVYTLVAAASMARIDRAAALHIEITGEQWWWRVRYLDANGAALLVSANEIRIPVGQVVELTLRSADVIHSFWVPSLAGKLDMIPGRVNRLRLVANTAGIARGQCAEFCGGPHGQMALFVVAEPPEDFARWLAARRESASPPRDAEALMGHDLFIARGCGVCHAVRGTAAAGTRGPDLTHVASRLSIGAGTLPANAAAFARWIASSQHVKPENLMPSFTDLRADELRALAAYLEGLR